MVHVYCVTIIDGFSYCSTNAGLHIENLYALCSRMESNTFVFVVQDQLEQHVDKHVQLQVFTYYGQNRTSDVKQLAENDIVLTTYQTLAADSKVCTVSALAFVSSVAIHHWIIIYSCKHYGHSGQRQKLLNRACTRHSKWCGQRQWSKQREWEGGSHSPVTAAWLTIVCITLSFPCDCRRGWRCGCVVCELLGPRLSPSGRWCTLFVQWRRRICACGISYNIWVRRYH